MQQYWFCSDHNVKLIKHVNRYSSTAIFTLKKENIPISLNNAVAVKKIEPASVDRGIEMATSFFASHPEASELEFLGTICAHCKRMYASPRFFKTNDIEELDFHRYNTWWLFRSPIAEKEKDDNRQRFLWYYLTYFLYAYLLNYTLLLEMKFFGKYRKIGLYVLFPLVLVVIALYLVYSRQLI